jgi:hypothetical protein
MCRLRLLQDFSTIDVDLGSEAWDIWKGDESRSTAPEMKFMSRTAVYKSLDYKTI